MGEGEAAFEEAVGRLGGPEETGVREGGSWESWNSSSDEPTDRGKDPLGKGPLVGRRGPGRRVLRRAVTSLAAGVGDGRGGAGGSRNAALALFAERERV